MANSKTAITSGHFMDFLERILKGQGEKDPYYRKDWTKPGIKYQKLDPEHAARFLLMSGRTVEDIFSELKVYQNGTSKKKLPYPELTEEDHLFIRAAESLTEEEAEFVFSTIHRIVNPWWLDKTGELQYAPGRLREVIRKRAPAYMRSQQKNNFPYVKSILPIPSIQTVNTDIIPFLANELDVSYMWFLDTTEWVPVHSFNQMADKLYEEYKMVEKPFRPMIFSLVQALSTKGEHAGKEQ